jgi:hypothetical protein
MADVLPPSPDAMDRAAAVFVRRGLTTKIGG